MTHDTTDRAAGEVPDASEAIYDAVEQALHPYAMQIPPRCDSHGRRFITEVDGEEMCQACYDDGFSGECGFIHADTMAIDVIKAFWPLVRKMIETPAPRAATDLIAQIFHAVHEADQKAIKSEDEKTGFVSFYTFPTGPWHKIIALVRQLPVSDEDMLPYLSDAIPEPKPASEAGAEGEDVVERVARAIAAAPTHSNPNGHKWTDLNEYGWDVYRRYARAAIQAVRGGDDSEVAHAVAQMAAHDRDEALVRAMRAEKQLAEREARVAELEAKLKAMYDDDAALIVNHDLKERAERAEAERDEARRVIGNQEHGFKELHAINRQNIAERDAARKRVAELERAEDVRDAVCEERNMLAKRIGELEAALGIAKQWRDWLVSEGFTIDRGAMEDCRGDKCRRPQCVACFGDAAYECDAAQSEYGMQVRAFDKALDADKRGGGTVNSGEGD